MGKRILAQTLFDKLWERHVVASLEGGESLLYIDRLFLHERTGSVALESLRESGRDILAPERVFCAIDHIVDTRPGRTDQTLMPGGSAFIKATRDAARRSSLTLFDVQDPEQGIVHVISPELGIVLPGVTLVCPDSHTCTQGAFGALAFGIGSSEAEQAMATGVLKLRKPKTMLVRFDGDRPKSVTAKDLALSLIAKHGADGGLGYGVEFAGSMVDAMTLSERMTLCNMAVEFGAFSAVIAPDQKTYDFLQGRRYAPTDDMWDAALKDWTALTTDTGAIFDKVITLAPADIGPTITWGTSPEQACRVGDPVPSKSRSGREDAAERARTYMGVEPGMDLGQLSIDGAFIGSCTNARLEDLRAAAGLLKGQKVATGVRALCVPGSMLTKHQAEAEGLDKIFKDAGFEWRESGCSLCFYAGGESFDPGSRVVSTTNRNFENRQGKGVRTHIASPLTVAASAILGRIGGVADLEGQA